MHLQTVFVLSLGLDSEKFHKLLTRAYNTAEFFDENEGKYIDQSLGSKGITITYRDSQYKKKVKLLVNRSLVLGNDEHDSDKLLRKLEKRIESYFGSKYQIDDFDLTGMVITTDIDVHDRKNVAAYMKVLRRVGKVKGFSPSSYECFDDNISFCLDGNSNGIEFMIYDLEGILRKKLDDAEHGRKQLKSMIENSKGTLRAEVRLTEPKTIRACTEKTRTFRQIADLSEKREKIFLDTFMRIIPFGNFYKKDKAVELLRKEVIDQRLRRRMLRLMALVPEKKSLSLAQKALNYRRIDDVMEMYAEINLSPVTISKRHDIKHLQNLYTFL